MNGHVIQCAYRSIENAQTEWEGVKGQIDHTRERQNQDVYYNVFKG
jgi:hypothetical protein